MIFESDEDVKQLINEIPNIKEAIRTAIRLSGLDDKYVWRSIPMDVSHGSRILAGLANLPLEKVPLFNKVVGNNIVTIFLAKECGYDVIPSREFLQEKNREQCAHIKYLENKLKEKCQCLIS